MASNGIGDSRRLARGSTRQLGSVTEPPKAHAGRPLCPAVLFRTLRKRILRWEEDLAKAAQRGRRTNDEVEASEKERKQVTRLAPKPVTPHGTAPRQGRSEGTAWDGKGRRLAKSKRGGHGRGGGPRLTDQDAKVRLHVHRARPQGSACHRLCSFLGPRLSDAAPDCSSPQRCPGGMSQPRDSPASDETHPLTRDSPAR